MKRERRSEMRRYVTAMIVGAALLSGVAPAGARTHHPAGEPGPACSSSVRSLAAVTRAAGPQGYDDFIEDSGNAPDFCGANLVTNDNETLTIGVHVHNRSEFGAGDIFGVLLDTDGDAATGNEGVDYAIVFDGNGGSVGHWNGTSFEDVPGAALTVEWVPGYGPVLELRRAALASDRFNFRLVGLNGEDADVAPDAGWWSYTATPLTLTARSLRVGPAKAGRAVRAELVVIRSDWDAQLTEGEIACKARLAGKPLAGRGAFVNDRAVCVWRLPKSARGKRLAGALAVGYQGVTARRSFAVRVR
jgi:hypothetical protein